MSVKATTATEAEWAFDRMGFRVPKPYAGITFELNDEIQAIAFFYHVTANDVEVALAAKSLSKHFLRELHNFMANTLQVSRITLKTRADRTDTTKLYKRLGAEYEGTQKFFYDDGTDALLFRLDPQNFKFR